MVQFFIRSPRFPVICDVQGIIICARTARKLSEAVDSIELPQGEYLRLIDTAAEGWILDTDHKIVSPLTFRKHWTKKEVIELFNRSKTAKQRGLEFSARSLSSKRFDRIMGEIVELILSADKSVERDRAI